MKKIFGLGLYVSSVLSLCLLLLAVVLSLCGCFGNKDGAERKVSVAISLECTGVYGLSLEYYVDRVPMGYMEVLSDPNMTTALQRDIYVADFPDQGFHSPDDIDNGLFGLTVRVISDVGEYIPVEYLFEWSAAYGKEYMFTLYGDAENGFSFVPADNCFMTPLKDVSADLIN